MAVFDITTRESFENVRDWRKEIENNAEEDILCYLVGNFADLEEDRKVQKYEAIALCKELGFASYIETSAFTGQNIDSLFETLTKHLFVANEHKLQEYVSIYTLLTQI
jgi:GTPase SAR1 family protein